IGLIEPLKCVYVNLVFWLRDDELIFPNLAVADQDWPLAIGGGLSTVRCLLAYGNRFFAWFTEGDPVCWYAPHERCVIFPDQIYISRSMRKVLKTGMFELSYDQDFESVIRNCAKVSRKNQPGTWISAEMQRAYIRLHRAG